MAKSAVFLACALAIASKTNKAIEQQNSKNFVKWDKLVGVTNARMNSSGDLVAVQSGSEAQIWKVSSSGEIEVQLWESNLHNANSYLLNYAWSGNKLLISKLDNLKLNEIRGGYSEEEEQKILQKKGSIIQVDLKKGESTRVLDSAYLDLAVHSSGQVAAITPTADASKGSKIVFYNRDFQKTGQWQDKTAPEIGSVGTYIIGWAQDGTGIYVVRSNEEQNQDKRERLLYFVTPDGKARDVLPRKAWLVQVFPHMLPLSSVTHGQELALMISYFNSADAAAIVSPNAIQSSVSWSDIREGMKGIQTEPVALSPNGRFLLLQEISSASEEKIDTKVNLWAVDLKSKKRKSLGQVPRIVEACQWDRRGILIKNGGKAGYGLLSFSEGSSPVEDENLNDVLAKTKERITAPN